MSFDISSCRKKFEDLSGVIQWGEIINDGETETFRIFVRNLTGTKADYDTILKEDIEPYFPNLQSYCYDKERNKGSVFGIECRK
tara:strand:+ start:273 stop:524 length:252 start_codon:yes stop_codon:yes gene_type:complete